MEIRIVFENGAIKIVDDSQKEKRVRPGRGKSLLMLLDDFTSLDLETTGFSPEYCEIIEVACIRYRGGVEIDSFTSLVRPSEIEDVDNHITALTGITQGMLEDAPCIETVLPQVLAFIGNDTIVGHKASFDINFLYDNADWLGLGAFGNNYIDTMRMSQRLFPDFKNHKLRTLIKEFKIADNVAHRSESDARQTALCYLHMVDYVRKNNLSGKFTTAYSSGRGIRAADITGNPDLLKENSPLYGKNVVFTGVLERMTRREAMQIVADLGGINGDTVTKKTDYLVLGNNDMCASIKGGKSNKQKLAEKYILAGSDMSIISENVFYDMLSVDSGENEFADERINFKESSTAYPVIPSPGLELSSHEMDFVARLSEILHNHPAYDSLVLEKRSDSYVSVVIGNNDFMRFKYSSRAKWISLDLPGSIANKNKDNPIFAAQKNKAQRHWKASITTLDDLNKLADFIIASCKELS